MGSAAVRPSRRLADLLRRRRRELKLTLREVSERTAERGERLPPSTLARIEQGKLEPGVRRMLLLMEVYDVPSAELKHRVSLDNVGLKPPRRRDPSVLYDRAVEVWKEGRGDEALNYLLAAREAATEQGDAELLHRATLTSAVVLRNVGQVRFAKQMVDDLLCEPLGDPEIVVKTLVLSSSLWRILGSSTMARLTIEHARSLLRPDQHELFALVLHQAAKLAYEEGRLEDAEDLLGHALRHYRRLDDTYGEIRAHVLLVRVHEAAGRTDQAQRLVRRALRDARRNHHKLLELFCRIELGRLLVGAGETDPGLGELEAALGLALELRDANAEFHARHALWKAWQTLGNTKRAEHELASAKELVTRVEDDDSVEVREVRALAEKPRPRPRGRRRRA